MHMVSAWWKRLLTISTGNWSLQWLWMKSIGECTKAAAVYYEAALHSSFYIKKGNDIHVYTNCLILLFLCRYGNLETLTLLLGNGATKIIFFCAALPKYTKFGSTKQAPQLSPKAALPALCGFTTTSARRWRSATNFTNSVQDNILSMWNLKQ